MRIKVLGLTPALCAGIATLAGCSGGGGDGGGGSVAPLSVPAQMTIVDAQELGSSASLRIPGVGRAVSGGTDYDTDRSRLWVHDESMEPLDTVNMILCSLAQTGYDDPSVLNAGPYVALVDGIRCETGSGGEQQGGGQQVEYEEWVVDSTRAADDQPQVVRFWIDMDEEYEEGEIVEGRLYGRLTIFESPSDALPYGRFELHFKQLLRSAAPDSADVVFRGTLATSTRADGGAEYTFWMTDGDVDAPLAGRSHASLSRARVRVDAATDTGQAYTSHRFRYDDGNQEVVENLTFHVAFDDRYLARRRVGASTDTLVFDRDDFDVFAWRYGLYGADTGSRLDIESGFPILTADGQHGWAGYHGLWLPPRVAVTQGMAVRRNTWDRNTAGEEYTVFVSRGRLVKRERLATTLGALAGEDMRWWDPQSTNQVRVRWNGSQLERTAVWSEAERNWIEDEPPVSLMDRFGAYDWVSLWSDARGDVNFTWPGEGSPTDATEVTIWSQQTIDADSPELAAGDLMLYGYRDALRPQVTLEQAQWQNQSSPFFPPAEDPQGGYEYVFQKSDLMLYHDGLAVTFADSITAQQGRRLGGLSSGPMLTSAPASVYELHLEPVVYRWETGFDEWQQLRALVDAQGAFVRFDRPQVFDYQHDQPGHPMHGKRFQLQYEGVGSLHGIPHRDDGRGRWYPEFSIPTGAVVTNDLGSFKVKVLEGEQRMRAVADPQAVLQSRGLDLDTTLEPPADTWRDPAAGPKPTVDAAPRFVGGVRQDA